MNILHQVSLMVRYTSILLPLAQSRKKRLEEAAEARGETLESFILEAAAAEASRAGQKRSERGHRVGPQIHASTVRQSRPSWTLPRGSEDPIEANRVALELGWGDGPPAEWLEDVDRLIANLDTLDVAPAVPAPHAAGSNSARRGSRRSVRSVQVLNPVQGMVVDMSESGLGVETKGPFSVPEAVHVSIGQAMACAKVWAEVRWCVLVRTESLKNGEVIPIYRSGLAFLGT